MVRSRLIGGWENFRENIAETWNNFIDSLKNVWSSIKSGAGKVGDWFRKNWFWVLLFAVIIGVIVLMVYMGGD